MSLRTKSNYELLANISEGVQLKNSYEMRNIAYT